MVIGQSLLLTVQAEDQPAFPGAEGYGRYTTGGRGGAVYHVTSLVDDGSEGTFRWACEQKGARTIVFDLSGTIFLTKELKMRNGDVTIAGQSAPGDGICIADYPFVIACSNVIIRYMRFRLGNRHVDEHEGDGLSSMDNDNIIIDHCSVSWSIDECLSVYGGKNLTIQWSISSQSLNNSGHTKGSHGYGGNWGGSGASYHHNLMAHHKSRTPRLGPRPGTQLDERMDYRNNVIYNWAGEGCYGGEAMKINMVNNYYKPGPATATRNETLERRIAKLDCRTTSDTKHDTDKPNDWDKTWHVWGKYYVVGNMNDWHDDVAKSNWRNGIYNQMKDGDKDGTVNQQTRDTIRIDQPIPFVSTTTHATLTAYEKVLDYVGACKSRDWLDEQIVSDVLLGAASSGDNGLIDSQEEVKGSHESAWPELTYTKAQQEAIKDTDGDGIPDTWESANGLNPNNAADGAEVARDGYTYLEHYLNSLVEDITFAQNDEGVVLQGMEMMPGTDVEEESSFNISQQTFTGESHPTERSSIWNFDKGFRITIDENEVFAAGTFPGISGGKKYDPDIAYVIEAPDGIQITGVKILGGSNSASIRTYVYKIDDKIFGEKDYRYPLKDGTDAQGYDFTLSEPKSKVPVVFGGAQGVFVMEVYYLGTTGIREVRNVEVGSEKPSVWYSLDGRKYNVKPAKKGIYIVGGKKVAY